MADRLIQRAELPAEDSRGRRVDGTCDQCKGRVLAVNQHVADTEPIYDGLIAEAEAAT